MLATRERTVYHALNSLFVAATLRLWQWLPFVWLEVLSYVKALFEAITLGADVREQYQRHRSEQATIDEATRVSQTFSTFSEQEVEAILYRLKACRHRFIKEGSGAARKQCLCNVFNDVIEGNGGRLPRIDDWENIYGLLNCPRIRGAR